MRTRLFRKQTLVDGDSIRVVLADLDGVNPVTLYLENVDIPAKFQMIRGSKNANLLFTAVTAGSGGNALSVEALAVPDQMFSVVVAGNKVTINLACDSEGHPFLLASSIMTLVNADPYASALLEVSLAPGSDGGGVFDTLAETALSGGFDATQGGNVVVEHSPVGWPSYAGPWDESLPASNAFSGISAGIVRAFDLDVPVRGLRITADMDGLPTTFIASGIAPS